MPCFLSSMVARDGTRHLMVYHASDHGLQHPFSFSRNQIAAGRIIEVFSYSCLATLILCFFLHDHLEQVQLLPRICRIRLRSRTSCYTFVKVEEFQSIWVLVSVEVSTMVSKASHRTTHVFLTILSWKPLLFTPFTFSLILIVTGRPLIYGVSY
jgi:hypothetical protein